MAVKTEVVLWLLVLRWYKNALLYVVAYRVIFVDVLIQNDITVVRYRCWMDREEAQGTIGDPPIHCLHMDRPLLNVISWLQTEPLFQKSLNFHRCMSAVNCWELTAAI